MDLKKQKSYQQALEMAIKEIRSLDPVRMAEQSGGFYEEKGGKPAITLLFWGAPYCITFPEIQISSPEKYIVSLVTRIVLLHYLIRADGTERKGEPIPYKEIPGGMMYAPVFQKRVVDPLVRVFGNDSEAFLQAGIAIKGERTRFGDISFVLKALPRVSITFVLWRGDEEFPPSIQILFERSIDRYLSLEDVVVLGEMAARRLIAQKSQEKKADPPGVFGAQRPRHLG